jgi:hypothetical protein
MKSLEIKLLRSAEVGLGSVRIGIIWISFPLVLYSGKYCLGQDNHNPEFRQDKSLIF